mgnify:CR=1 FL=1
MRFGIYPNLGKNNLQKCLQKLCPLLQEKGIDYSFPLSMEDGLKEMGFSHDHYESVESMGQREIILSVGGDGSFLGAARTFSGFPVLMAGVHLGELGFLNTITMADMEERLDLILQGDYQTESRVFLSSSIVKENGDKEILPDVLNDVVVGHKEIGQLARIRFFVNGHFIQEYAADGLIISSPTGSTGYALSCGGPVLGPSNEEMIVVPICAHTLQRFGIVLKSGDCVEIGAAERENTLHVSMDGAYCYPLDNKDRLQIRTIHKPIRFIRFKDQEFFGSITKKLIRKIVEN